MLKLNKIDYGQLVITKMIASLYNISQLERVLSAKIRLLKKLIIKIIIIKMQEIAKIEIA
jgi:hypothetical protein